MQQSSRFRNGDKGKILTIQCEKCYFDNAVHTGKVQNNVSEINVGVILGKLFL